ncbi:protein AKNAD1 [Grus japonensis]|uniref:Protein AKNAD1 n=1 Tax=Grus japonensis TaxID=30415 RepID=A0ABC9X6U1_GRUJA
MSTVLLRHFSKGELISRCQLIECETIPETSFTESIDDTLNKPEPSEHVKGPLAYEQWATNFEDYHLEKHQEISTGAKNHNSLNENRCVSEKPTSSTAKFECRQENSQLINENEDTRIFQNMKEESTLFKKTVSPHELRHGQGHHCLPDFSRVASEVQVPKRSDNINSVPTAERTKSFPVLSKSVIVNNVLENKNYFNSAEVGSQEEMSIPQLLQQLESSVGSSIADPPERRAIETAFLHKNKEAEKSQTTDVIPPTNQFSLEIKKCNLCLHMLQERDESTSRRVTEPLGKGGLLPNKHASNLMRKPTDLSDTNLSSDSDDISAYDSYNDSQSKELVNCETESYKTFNTRLCGEGKGRRCRCPRESRDEFKLRNYRESVQSCALRRNKSSGSTSYSERRISTQKAQKNKQPRELVNRLSERQNFEAAKTCYSSTYDKVILSHQDLPGKKSAQSKSAINIRNTNDSNANILSSTLDHAIQTANSLKKATERMLQAVSEDLAQVKRNQL